MLLSNIFVLTSCLLGFAHGYLNNGKTDLVQWDRSSLVVNGKRVYIFSGEFHYPRLPVPELWLDIFQKMRASGFNAASIYFFWSYHEAKQGNLDFKSGAKDIQRLFDYAKQAGIWIICRPGPYINAETSAGGLAFWATTGAHGVPRTADENYHQAWLPYITQVGKIIAANQITKGGPVILVQHENEYLETNYNANDTKVLHMKQLIAAYDAAGVVVPSTHNEIGMRGISWSTDYNNVGGAVNIYGLDSYPNGFNCAVPDSGFKVVRTYYDWFQKASPTQPSYIPEFQGGAMDNWGGSSYENCALMTGTKFVDVFYKSLVMQKVSLMSLYMAYGGTNWGQSAAPVVYSSYDYGAPLAESRQVRDKMRETKLLTLFLRVSDDIKNTIFMGAGNNFTTSNPELYYNHLVNPVNNANFYYFTQNQTNLSTFLSFPIKVDTSIGTITTTGSLDGRQGKFMVTDYNFGTQTLAYSTAEILTYSIVDGHEVLVMYLNNGQSANFVLKGFSGTVTFTGSGATAKAQNIANRHTLVTYTQNSGQTVASFSNGVKIVLVDTLTAWNFWAPALTSSPDVSADKQIVVTGPYLVRTAAINGRTLSLTGDTNVTTPLEVFAPANIATLNWNGANVYFTRTSYNSIKATIGGPADISLPNLAALNWHSLNASPETNPDYDDSAWTVANHQTTMNPVTPETLPVLYPDDYGFHVGTKLYRGYFSNSGAPSAIYLKIGGGIATGLSVWVNGVFVGSWKGDTTTQVANMTFQFEKVVLKQHNVMTIIHDYNGHDESSVKNWGPRNPRGIINASLIGAGKPGFTLWKLNGNAGGEAGLDAIRHPFNEGGLNSERIGAHLPGFTSTNWTKKAPTTGLSSAGVEFYTADFQLALPAKHDVPLAIVLSSPANTVSRVQIYVNGYQYGKYNPHIGPQTVFPLQPGIINNNGKNKVSVTIWAMTDAGAKLSDIQLVAQGKYNSGFDLGFDFDASYLQPVYSRSRRAYY